MPAQTVSVPIVTAPGKLVLYVAVGVLSSTAEPQSEELVFRSQAELQNLSVQVIDKDGHFVPRLAAEDFRITEDGQPRKIIFFGESQQPLSVAILTSEPKLRKQAQTAFRRRNPGDEISLIDPGESIYQTLATTVCQMGMRRNMRRAIIAVITTDSVPGLASQERLMKLSEGSSAPIFIVGLNRGDGSDLPVRVLNELAHRSDGRTFYPGSQAELSPAIDHIAALLRSEYSLAYRPENTGRFRKIEVATTRRDAFAILFGSRPISPVNDNSPDLAHPSIDSCAVF
jgi:hypothetical protein